MGRPYVMREDCVYLVNPLRGKRHSVKRPSPAAARSLLNLQAKQAGVAVNAVVLHASAVTRAGGRVEIANAILPDTHGIGYWHISHWCTVVLPSTAEA